MTPYAFLILLSPVGCEKGNFSPLGATLNSEFRLLTNLIAATRFVAAGTRVRIFPTVELGCTHTHQGVLKPER